MLRSLAHEFFWQFANEVKKQTGRSYFKAVSEIDQQRLLTLRNWMQTHKVSLAFIVKHVVVYWQKKFTHRTRFHKFGIGVGIPTVCGNVSEQILISAIAKEFPNEENVFAWKSSQKQIRLLKPVKNVSGDDFVERYIRVMGIRQARNDYALASGKFTKRRYRGNPWI